MAVASSMELRPSSPAAQHLGPVSHAEPPRRVALARYVRPAGARAAGGGAEPRFPAKEGRGGAERWAGHLMPVRAVPVAMNRCRKAKTSTTGSGVTTAMARM